MGGRGGGRVYDLARLTDVCCRSPHPPHLFIVDASTTTPDMVSHLPLPLLLRFSNGGLVKWPFDATDPTKYPVTEESLEIEGGIVGDDE